MILYRYLTGPDTVVFCQRITKALNRGWTLAGQPTLAFDQVKGQMICGQTIMKTVEGIDYTDDIVLSDY